MANDLFIVKKCPICKKEFIHNPRSVYRIKTGKINGNYRLRWYCGYTCWRKAGGGSHAPDPKIQEELKGRMYEG